jgi:hypothetical protein
MQVLPAISLVAKNTVTVPLDFSATSGQPVQGLLLANLSGFPLTITFPGGTKLIPPWVEDYVPVITASTGSIQITTPAGQVASNTTNPEVIATLFLPGDAVPAGYPLALANNVSNISYVPDDGALVLNVSPGNDYLYTLSETLRLVAFSGWFSTAAGGTARFPSLIALQGIFPYWLVGLTGPAGIGGSTPDFFVQAWAGGPALVAGGGNVAGRSLLLTSFPSMLLPAGTQIGTSTGNIQPGDTWNSIAMVFQPN